METVGCGMAFARIYFFSFMLIVSLIFLNLFIAIILQAYTDESEQLSLKIEEADIEIFRIVWSEFDPTGSGYI